MPRPVVPIAPGPCSATASTARWYGQDQVRRGAHAEPAARRRRRAPRAASTSSRSRARSTTTPLPIRQRVPACRMPEGTRWSTSVSPLVDHAVAGVGPALVAGDDVGARRSARRRSCPCPRRPTGRPPPPCTACRASRRKSRGTLAEGGRECQPGRARQRTSAAAGAQLRAPTSVAGRASASITSAAASMPARRWASRGRGAEVRRGDHVGQREQRRSPGRLGREHVERGAAQRARRASAACSAASSTMPPRARSPARRPAASARARARRSSAACLGRERHVERDARRLAAAARRASARGTHSKPARPRGRAADRRRRTVMPNARARSATSRPMRPKPTRPSVRPEQLAARVLGLLPAPRAAGRPRRPTRWRSSASSRPNVSSATETALAAGVLSTATPRCVAPPRRRRCRARCRRAPRRAASGAPRSTSAVTLVAPRTSSAVAAVERLDQLGALRARCARPPRGRRRAALERPPASSASVIRTFTPRSPRPRRAAAAAPPRRPSGRRAPRRTPRARRA